MNFFPFERHSHLKGDWRISLLQGLEGRCLKEKGVIVIHPRLEAGSFCTRTKKKYDPLRGGI